MGHLWSYYGCYTMGATSMEGYFYGGGLLFPKPSRLPAYGMRQTMKRRDKLWGETNYSQFVQALYQTRLRAARVQTGATDADLQARLGQSIDFENRAFDVFKDPNTPVLPGSTVGPNGQIIPPPSHSDEPGSSVPHWPTAQAFRTYAPRRKKIPMFTGTSM